MSINFGRYTLEQRGDDWWLIVENDGEGMVVSLKEIDILLDRYYRGEF